MSDLLVVCEACGAKNSVKPELKAAAVCGQCKAPLKTYHEPLDGCRLPEGGSGEPDSGAGGLLGPVVHALQDDQSHRP